MIYFLYLASFAVLSVQAKTCSLADADAGKCITDSTGGTALLQGNRKLERTAGRLETATKDKDDFPNIFSDYFPDFSLDYPNFMDSITSQIIPIANHSKGLLTCLQGLPDKWHYSNVYHFTEDLFDEADFLKSFFEQYLGSDALIDCGGTQTPEEALASWASDFSLKAANDSLNDPDFLKSALEKGWAELDKFTSKCGMEPMECLVNWVIKPVVRDHLDSAAEALQPVFDKAVWTWGNATTMINRQIAQHVGQYIEEIRQSPVGEGIEYALRKSARACTASGQTTGRSLSLLDFSLPDAQRAVEHAKSVAVEACHQVIYKLTDVVEMIVKLHAETESVRVALKEVVDENGTLNTSALITTAVAIATQRYGEVLWNTILQRIVNPIISKASQGLRTLFSSIMHYMGAIAGLIPYVGSSIAAFLHAGVEFALGAVLDLLSIGAVELLRTAYDHALCKVQHLTTEMLVFQAGKVIPTTVELPTMSDMLGSHQEFTAAISPFVPMFKYVITVIGKYFFEEFVVCVSRAESLIMVICALEEDVCPTFQIPNPTPMPTTEAPTAIPITMSPTPAPTAPPTISPTMTPTMPPTAPPTVPPTASCEVQLFTSTQCSGNIWRRKQATANVEWTLSNSEANFPQSAKMLGTCKMVQYLDNDHFRDVYTRSEPSDGECYSFPWDIRNDLAGVKIIVN